MNDLEYALKIEKISAKKILELEKKYFVPAITHFYKEPKLIVRGSGAKLYDSEGKEYIDLCGGVCTVLSGHCNKKIVSALKRQLELLIHTTTLYPTAPIALYAKKLVSKMPSGLNKCFFVNSGSEANEAAIHLIKKYTGCNFIISLNESFHGRTLMAMSLTNQSVWRQNVTYASGTISVPNANCYRCDFGKAQEECDLECARYIEKAIRCQTPNKIGCFIAEPIQGNGGIIVPPKEYFKVVFEIVKKYDGVFLSDEVQTGFGRTGKYMWGIEHWNIKPDIITLAKGMGSGFPIGGFVSREEIASCLKPKDLFSTFGGNPLSMIAGLANLEVIEEENYPLQAHEKGEKFKKLLFELMKKHEIIGDVRGMGLMLGFELVKSRERKEPATEETAELMELAFREGLLLGLGGLNSNIIRIQPPIPITEKEIEKAIKIIDGALGRIEGK
ncbi:MAG: aspartate aminotransferase family protein [Candidatus Thermoplasmatota archaeon]